MADSKRPLVLGIVGILAAVIAIYMFFGYGRSAERPTAALVKGVCLACQQEVESEHALHERAPFVCPKCGEQAVYPWLYCFECNMRFVPRLEQRDDGGPPRMPAHPRCPACRSRGVGAFIPEIANPETTDAPLPEWTP